MVVANSSLKKEQENRRKMLQVQFQSLRFLEFKFLTYVCLKNY